MPNARTTHAPAITATRLRLTTLCLFAAVFTQLPADTASAQPGRGQQPYATIERRLEGKVSHIRYDGIHPVFRPLEIRGGGVVERWTGPFDTVHAISFDPSGRRMLLADSSTDVTFWNLQGPTLLQRFGLHLDQPYAAAIDSTGRVLSSGKDRFIIQSNVANAMPAGIHRIHRDSVRQIIIHPNAQIFASMDESGTVRLGQLDQIDKAAALPFPRQSPVIAFHPAADLLLIGTANGRLQAVSLADYEATGELNTLWTTSPTNGRPIAAIAPRADSTIAVVAMGQAAILSPADGTTLRRCGAPNSLLHGQHAIDRHGRRFAVLLPDHILVYDLDTNALLTSLPHLRFESSAEPAPTVSTIALTPDAQTLLVALTDRSILRWDLQQAGALRTLPAIPRDGLHNIAPALATQGDELRLVAFAQNALHTWTSSSTQPPAFAQLPQPVPPEPDAVPLSLPNPHGMVAWRSADHILITQPARSAQPVRIPCPADLAPHRIHLDAHAVCLALDDGRIVGQTLSTSETWTIHPPAEPSQPNDAVPRIALSPALDAIVLLRGSSLHAFRPDGSIIGSYALPGGQTINPAPQTQPAHSADNSAILHVLQTANTRGGFSVVAAVRAATDGPIHIVRIGPQASLIRSISTAAGTPLAALSELLPGPGGRALLARTPQALHLLDAFSGQITWSFPLSDAAGSPIALSADRNRAAWLEAAQPLPQPGADRKDNARPKAWQPRLLNLASAMDPLHAQLGTQPLDTPAAASAAADLPDGSTLVGAANGSVYLFEPELPIHTAHWELLPTTAIRQLAPVGPDQALALLDNGRLWLIHRHANAPTPLPTDLPVLSIATADQAIYLGLSDGRILRATDLQPDAPDAPEPAEPQSTPHFEPWAKLDAAPTALHLLTTRNHTLLAAGRADGHIDLIDAQSAQILRRLSGHTGPISRLASSGSDLLSASLDWTARRWINARPEAPLLYAEHAGWVTGIAPGPDDSVWTSAGDGVLRQFDSVARCVRRLRPASGPHRMLSRDQRPDAPLLLVTHTGRCLRISPPPAPTAPAATQPAAATDAAPLPPHHNPRPA